MRKSTHLIGMMFIGCFIFSAVLFTSCGDDDPVRGCTDANAENYNANAEEDDGSCVFARDKFFGTYAGELDCAVLMQISTDMFSFEITEGFGSDGVIINFLSGAAAGLGFPGTVSGNDIAVQTTLTGIPLLDLNGDGVNDPVNVDASGTVTTTDNGQTISGPLTLVATEPMTGVSLSDICTVTGTKQ